MRTNTVARRGYRSAVQARRLLADVHLASSVTEATIELPITDQVKRAIANEDCYLGTVILRKEERFYFVASKFVGRYYVVVQRDGRWLCSSREERTRATMVAKVETFNAQRQRRVAV